MVSQAIQSFEEDADPLALLLQDTPLCNTVSLTQALAHDSLTTFEALAINFLWDFGVSLERAARDPEYSEYTPDSSLRTAVGLQRITERMKAFAVEDLQLQELDDQDIGPNALQRLMEAVTLAGPTVAGLTAAAAALLEAIKCVFHFSCLQRACVCITAF